MLADLQPADGWCASSFIGHFSYCYLCYLPVCVKTSCHQLERRRGTVNDQTTRYIVTPTIVHVQWDMTKGHPFLSLLTMGIFRFIIITLALLVMSTVTNDLNGSSYYRFRRLIPRLQIYFIQWKSL